MVLPVRGGGHDQRPLPLAERRHDVEDAAGGVLARGVGDFHAEALLGVERRQIVEIDLVAQVLRRVEIDVVELEQGEIALAVARRPDLPLQGVARAQAEAADLTRAHIDVVGAGQIVGLRRAQEAEPVRQGLEHARAEDRLVVLGELPQDREHQVLAAHRVRVLDLKLFGVVDQLSRCLGLELLQMHGGDCRCGAGNGRRRTAARERHKPGEDRRMTFSRGAPAAGGEIARPFRRALGLPYRLPFAGVKRRFGGGARRPVRLCSFPQAPGARSARIARPRARIRATLTRLSARRRGRAGRASGPAPSRLATRSRLGAQDCGGLNCLASASPWRW